MVDHHEQAPKSQEGFGTLALDSKWRAQFSAKKSVGRIHPESPSLKKKTETKGNKNPENPRIPR